MNRFQQAEELAAATREEIPKVAVRWLAAARAPLEKLTMAALDPDLTDEAFLALVDGFSKSLPGLLDAMDHDALAKLMEHGMGAGMANGISVRSAEWGARSEEKRAKLPWETDAWLAGNKNHDPKDGRFTSGPGGSAVRISGQRWEGGTKVMHKRAAEALHEMKGMKPFQHPESKTEMKVTADGIRKSLHDMRTPEEFMAAARFREIFLHSTKKGEGEPDRKKRHGIKAFHRFETEVEFGKQRHTVEIITKELDGSPIHHLKQIRFKK